MRQGAFLNMPVDKQLIKPPNLVNLKILARAVFITNLLNNMENWGYLPDPFQFRNLLQLLSNQLCQVSIVSFF